MLTSDSVVASSLRRTFSCATIRRTRRVATMTFRWATTTTPPVPWPATLLSEATTSSLVPVLPTPSARVVSWVSPTSSPTTSSWPTRV
ncbi:hypothetical protein EVA_18521 [gut metagenome]|uniref:Uncharacterized protein n=1 Tax=gut metagenome TaxID=749906 RepID=J9FUW3_9ZZZZ